MKTVPNWNHSPSFLERDLNFKNFNEALMFLNRVAELAELQQHHPIFIHNYNKLKIQLNTHDVQGISHKDFELAQAIDQLAL
jgi:4a-hydroxytetrahydrobiopterin dehydratase